MFEKIARKVITVKGRFFEYFQISAIDKDQTKIEILGANNSENFEKFYEQVQVNWVYLIANCELRTTIRPILKYDDVNFYIELKRDSIVNHVRRNEL